jgi:YggT family protein
MATVGIAAILSRIITLYVFLIIAYVLMSWIPVKGVLYDVYRVLGSIVEPYLGLFRRIVPPIGMVDISPIVAIIVLQLVGRAVVNLLATGRFL